MAIKKKKKAVSIGKLTDKAADLLQLLVRLKASDDLGYCSCVTCGTTRKYNQGMQGGHFIERGKRATKLMEENIHPQCDGCNGFGMKFHGMEKIYTLWMVDFYGRDFVDEMIFESKQVKKWYRPELEYLIIEFKERIKVEQARIG